MPKNIKPFLLWFFATYAVGVVIIFFIGAFYSGAFSMLQTMLDNPLKMISFAAPAIIAGLLGSRDRSGH